MGSVGDNYRCPWCGRKGMGGYSPDRIGVPLCTEGDYSCLWFTLCRRNWVEADLKHAAVKKIFMAHKYKHPLTSADCILGSVATFLGSTANVAELPYFIPIRRVGCAA